jgi:Flp pilus assembly secretin CpaC
MLRKLVTIIGVAMLFALPANAANDEIEIAVNKAHLIQLDTDASIVMIANPAIADVAVESPRVVFLLGKSPGETSLFILDADGNDLVRAEVIVSVDIDEPMADMMTSVETMPMMTAAPSAPKKKERDVTIYRNVSSTTTLSCSPECNGSGSTQ